MRFCVPFFLADNTITFESVWDKPDGFCRGGKDPQIFAVLKIQSLFRGKRDRRRVDEKKEALKARAFRFISYWLSLPNCWISRFCRCRPKCTEAQSVCDRGDRVR